MDLNKEERVNKAVALFKSGYNCSQSVVGAFTDLYDVPADVVMKIAASFGGGIGRMRQTCGAACGMYILAGLEQGNVLPDKKAKDRTYKLVQQLAAEFKKRNGSTICAELLGLKGDIKISPVSEERTEEYYKKRTCAERVAEAADIWAEHLLNQKEPGQDE